MALKFWKCGFNRILGLRRLKISRQRFLELSRLSNVSICFAKIVSFQGQAPEASCNANLVSWFQAFNEKSIEFQEKMIFRGGLGDDTYLPEGNQVIIWPYRDSWLSYCVKMRSFKTVLLWLTDTAGFLCSCTRYTTLSDYEASKGRGWACHVWGRSKRASRV